MKNTSIRAFARCTVQAVLAATLFIAPLTASAQDDPNAAPAMQSAPSSGAATAPMHHHEGGMWKNLNLTDDQKAQMKALHDKFKADHPTPGSATKADRKALREQMEAILTPEQLAKMKQMRASHKMSHAQPNQMPTVAP